MPFIRFLASVHYILLAISIFLNSEIINPYSYYMKKGLVYITIITFFSCQPSSCFKYTKANTCSLYNMHLVSTYYTYIVLVILLLNKIMPSCSHYIEKKLVYIAIVVLFSRQLSFYIKCTKSNIYLSCNVWSVSDAKYL